MRRKSAIRAGIAAVAVVTALGVTLAVSGTSVDTTAPASARADADPKAPEQGEFGSVDCREAKCIALTFDAGPGKYTPELLDTLRDEKVPATFFLLGKKHIERYPETVRRIAAEHHQVASHTWSHPRLTDLDAEEIRAELSRTQRAIAALTGEQPTLMRPPQGRTDTMVSKISAELGLSQVLWSVTAKDYSTNDSALIEKRVLEQSEQDGIILLHDIYRGTVPAVPGIIAKLKKRGFTFVTVSQLMAPAAPQPGTVYRP